jgi:hypothetical protein
MFYTVSLSKFLLGLIMLYILLWGRNFISVLGSARFLSMFLKSNCTETEIKFLIFMTTYLLPSTASLAP